jgi:hypothetical protein
MNHPKTTSYIWASQEKAPDCECVDCAESDPIKDFNRDPTGYYVLIRVNFETLRIEVAICGKNHKIVKIFSGRNTRDLSCAIFQYEKKLNLEWFKEKSHIAYLGKELKKAELALSLGQNFYFQE